MSIIECVIKSGVLFFKILFAGLLGFLVAVFLVSPWVLFGSIRGLGSAIILMLLIYLFSRFHPPENSSILKAGGFVFAVLLILSELVHYYPEHLSIIDTVKFIFMILAGGVFIFAIRFIVSKLRLPEHYSPNIVIIYISKIFLGGVAILILLVILLILFFPPSSNQYLVFEKVNRVEFNETDILMAFDAGEIEKCPYFAHAVKEIEKTQKNRDYINIPGAEFNIIENKCRVNNSFRPCFYMINNSYYRIEFRFEDI